MTQYVFLRPSGYYLRYVIPTGYRHLLRARELRYTLASSSRKVATKRARAVVGKVDVLLGELARGYVVLDDDQIRETVWGYVEATRDELSDWHLHSPPRDGDEAEIHTGFLLDDLRGLQASLQSSNFNGSKGVRASIEGVGFSGDIEAEVCKLFGLDPATVDTSDIQFKKACREWASATTQLWTDHLKRLDGERTTADTDYLAATPPAQSAATPAVKPEGPRISEVLGHFRSNRVKTRDIEKTTGDGYELFVETFKDIMGNMPVDQVTPVNAADFRDRLLEYPTNKTKREAYRDKSAAELLAMEIPDTDRMSAATVNNYIVHLSTLFAWLRQQQIVHHNPFEGLAIKTKAKSYAAFSSADLRSIFTSPLYTPGSKYYKRPTTTAGHWWLLLMGIYTGARGGELVQMRLDDIYEAEGVLMAAIK